MLKTLLFACLASLALGSFAADEALVAAKPEPERVRMERIAAEMDPEQIIWIKAGAGEFLGIYRAAEVAKAEGTLLMLHDDGEHPAWPGDLLKIGQELPKSGWSTLAIALPSADASAASEKSAPEESAPDESAPDKSVKERINAAIAWLQQQGKSPIVIYGQGDGAHQAVSFICEATVAPGTIAAVVMVKATNMDSIIPDCFKGSKLPVLDVYEDHIALQAEDAAIRLAHAKREGLANYQQLQYRELLERRVLGFLRRHFR